MAKIDEVVYLTYEEMGKKVAEEALDGYIYKGKTLREWIDILAQTRWIPVSERLPEKNTAVLTYVSTGPSKTYCLAYWNDVREGWEEWIGYELIEKDRGYKVLAWMPLPEPYKAESEG